MKDSRSALTPETLIESRGSLLIIILSIDTEVVTKVPLSFDRIILTLFTICLHCLMILNGIPPQCDNEDIDLDSVLHKRQRGNRNQRLLPLAYIG